MKNTFILFLFISGIVAAQKTDCAYDLSEKTDSTSLRVLPQKLMHEKIFGSSKDYLFFSLINENGIPMVQVQYLQKSQDFIPTNCLSKNSKIILQLDNGKIVTLINAFDENCSDLNFDGTTNSNIRILNAFFYFTKNNYEALKESPVALLRIQFAGGSNDYVLKTGLLSETLQTQSNPATYFMDYLKCVE